MEPNNKCHLTEASIQINKDLSQVILNVSLSKLKKLNEYPYLLIIQSTTEHFARLMLYPINKDKILKISIWGINVQDKIFDHLSKALQDYDVIHSSGFCVDKQKRLLFECYLNLNLSDKKSESLKLLLNKVRNKFNEIIIDEIELKGS